MDAEFDDADFLAAVSAPNLDRPSRPIEQSTSKVTQPKPQALPRSGPSSILVSTRQKGNPILNHVKSLPWEYSDTPADYVLGATTCALFLSLKYHRLHPEYIYARIRALGKLYNLRILLVMVDIENHEQALQELSKTSMINNFTLILAWSAQEAGRYLELFKSYEHASPASIRARQAESYSESLKEFVTAPRNINKTDAATLISNFGTLRAAINAEPEQLAILPGWGEKKVTAWYSTVREPFRVKRAARVGGEMVGDRFVSIGSVPVRPSRENTRPETGSETPQSTGASPPKDNDRTSGNAAAGISVDVREAGQKRRLEEVLPDDLVEDYDFTQDDEEALKLAEASTSQTQAQAQTASSSATNTNTSKQPAGDLAPGIAAALAKYRQS